MKQSKIREMIDKLGRKTIQVLNYCEKKECYCTHSIALPDKSLYICDLKECNLEDANDQLEC